MARDDPHSLKPGEAQSAEEVWLEAIKASASGDAPDLELLTATYPHLALELAEISVAWQWLENQLPEDLDPEAVGLAVMPEGEDRYRRLDELARGGTGRIIRIWDEQLERELVMKIASYQVNPHSPGGSRYLGRFLAEAKVTGQLQHPGIVPVHDVGVDRDGHVFFTMKKVEGIELGEAFVLARANQEGWDLRRAVRALAHVTDALSYAHSQGVLHRDLKPANIMVGAFGEVYVMDWGLARIEEALEDMPELKRTSHPTTNGGAAGTSTMLRTAEGAVLGTPCYMSPEQALGQVKELGPATDIYSLGATLYQLLSGRAPYAEEQDQLPGDAVLERLRQRAPAPLHKVAKDAPVELVAIAERAMARSIEDRYPDIAALGADLRAFLEGRVVAAHRTGPWIELVKWIRRNRLSAAALGLLVGSLAVVAWMQGTRVRELGSANADLVAARDGARRRAHSAQLATAQATLGSGQPQVALRQLEATDPLLRGWIWDHLMSRTETSEQIYPLLSMTTGRGAFDFTPDGRFAVGEENGLVNNSYRVRFRAYDLMSMEQLFDLDATSEGIQTVEIIGNGPLVVVDQNTETLALRDLDQGGIVVREVLRPKRRSTSGLTQGLRLGIACSGDSSLLVHTDCYGFRELEFSFYALPSMELVGQLKWTDSVTQTREDYSVAVSQDGALIVLCAGDRRLCLLSPDTGVLWEGVQLEYAGSAYQRTALCFSPDSEMFAVGKVDGRVELRQVADGSLIREFQVFEEECTFVEFDPTGQRMAVASLRGGLRVLDLEDGELLFRAVGHSSAIVGMRWLEDGVNLWTTSRDGTMRRWRIDRGTGLDRLEIQGCKVRNIWAEPDGPRLLVLDSVERLQLWDTSAGRLLGVFEDPRVPRLRVTEAMFIPGHNDVLALSKGGVISRLSTETFELISQGFVTTARGTPDELRTPCMSADGTRIAGAVGGTPVVVDVETLETLHRLPDLGPFSVMAFTAASDGLWCGQSTGELELYGLTGTEPELLQSIPRDTPITGLNLDPLRDRLFVGYLSGLIEVRSPVDGALLRTMGPGYASPRQFSFHPTENLMLCSGTRYTATTKRGETSLQVWDTEQEGLRNELGSVRGAFWVGSFVDHGTRIVAVPLDKRGVSLIDRNAVYRGRPLVEAARKRHRAQVVEASMAWPESRLLIQVLSKELDLDSVEQRAITESAYSLRVGSDGLVSYESYWQPQRWDDGYGQALARLAQDPETVQRYPDESRELVRILLRASRGKRGLASAVAILLHLDSAAVVGETLREWNDAGRASDGSLPPESAVAWARLELAEGAGLGTSREELVRSLDSDQWHNVEHQAPWTAAAELLLAHE